MDPAFAAHAHRPKAATLVRVSTAEQAADGRSGLERQRRSNESAVIAGNFEVVEAIEIIDVSGTDTFSTPEMLRLVSLVEAGKIDVLVVSEISRIFRPSDLSSFASLEIFKRNNVRLCCGGTIHDLSAPEGFLSSGIMSLLGGYERLSMQRKMMQSKEASRANGLCPSSAITLPVGLVYDRKTRKFSYNVDIWKVKEAFRLIDEDGIRNLSEVARRVSLHPRSLKNLLSNTYVTGVRSYTQKRDLSRKKMKPNGRQGDRPKIAREAANVIRVRIIPEAEQAVSDDRFLRVQSFLSGMADRHAKLVAPHKGINLLTGHGFCGYCGERLYTSSGSPRGKEGNRRGHYLCKSHFYLFKGKVTPCAQGWLSRAKMDELVSAFVLKFLDDPEFLAAIFNHAKSKQQEAIVGINVAPSTIRQQVSDLEQRDRRLLDAIESGAISLAEVKQRRQRLAEQKRSLLTTLKETGDSDGGVDVPKGLVGRLFAMGKEAWTSLTCPRERKKLISTLFMEIYVKGDSISAFRLAPSLVGADSGEWGWVADIPVTLPAPFRTTPLREPVSVPEGFRQCSRCDGIHPPSFFHGSRAACKSCVRADNNARYAKKAAALKQSRG